MKNQQINIPDNMVVGITAKELGEIRDYLSDNFKHREIRPIIDFIESKMISTYNAMTEEEDPKPIGGGGGAGAPKPPIPPTSE